MGCNYYKVISSSSRSDLKEVIKESIENNNYYINEDGYIVLQDVDIRPSRVHIGKSSAGWKFSIDFNNWKYFNKSEQSITDWINDTSDGSHIEDEYGNIISPEELLRLIDQSYTEPWYDGSERYDGESYHKAHPTHCYIPNREIYVGKYRVILYTDYL